MKTMLKLINILRFRCNTGLFSLTTINPKTNPELEKFRESNIQDNLNHYGYNIHTYATNTFNQLNNAANK